MGWTYELSKNFESFKLASYVTRSKLQFVTDHVCQTYVTYQYVLLK